MARRAILDHALPVDLCAELQALVQSLGVVGYRPRVRSLTLTDALLADARLAPPLVRARQLVWQAVEEAFGLEAELFVEFTGLMAWGAGSAIGWHHDANRPYLEQRSFSAVAYLNAPAVPEAPPPPPAAATGSAGSGCADGDDAAAPPPLLPPPGAASEHAAAFAGGDFEFQEGPPPLRVRPMPGRLVAFGAGEANVHRVLPVLWGERCTLSMWFTFNAAFAEDPKVLPLLCNPPAPSALPGTLYLTQPPPADEAAAAVPPSSPPAGTDVRIARLEALGAQLVLDASPAGHLVGRQGPSGTEPLLLGFAVSSENSAGSASAAAATAAAIAGSAGAGGVHPVSSVQHASLLASVVQWKVCERHAWRFAPEQHGKATCSCCCSSVVALERAEAHLEEWMRTGEVSLTQLQSFCRHQSVVMMPEGM